MTTIKSVLNPAFVLHSRAYRDTSLLVELLTEQFGRLTVVARGARTAKSKLQGVLTPFLPLLVTFSSKGELGNLQQAEVDGLRYDLKADLILSGFYLNELLIKLIPRHEPHPEIFYAYKNTLDDLTNSESPEAKLRIFEKCLLANLGYGLQLNKTVGNEEVLADEWYLFEFGVGLIRVNKKDSNVYSGKSLLALQSGNFSDENELRDAKLLLRGVIAELLGNKQIRSREMFYAKSGGRPAE